MFCGIPLSKWFSGAYSMYLVLTEEEETGLVNMAGPHGFCESVDVKNRNNVS